MRRRKVHPEAVGAVARRVLREAPLAEKKAQPESVDPRLIEGFRRAAGEVIASHARPRFIKDGVLFVAVDGPIWLQELSFLRKDLARKVAVSLGLEVTDLRLSLDRRPAAAAEPATKAPWATPAETPFPELPAEAKRDIDAATAPLAADAELHDAVARAMARWQARHKPR
jgi:hypothetical protein